MGLSLETEVHAFGNLLQNPVHPFVVVVGGAKISDKIDPIVNLSRIADAVLIGGGVANNFLKAVGIAVQKSYLQDTPADLKKEGLDYVELANQIISANQGERMLKDGYGTLCYQGVWSIFDQELVNYNLAVAPQGGLRIIPIVKGKYYGRVFKKPFMTTQKGQYKGYPFRTFSNGAFINGYSDHYPTYIIVSK